MSDQLQRSEKDAPITDARAIWTECADRLDRVIVDESQSRQRGKQALEFRWGNQWPDDVYNDRTTDNRPALTINHTNTFCSRVENQIRQDRARIKCQPVGDGANTDTADVVNGLIRHIEAISSAGVAYNIGGASAVNIGWGYWRILSRYLDEMSFDQELIVAPIRNAFSVYMDPAAVMPDGRDQMWNIITTCMRRTEYKRKYPNARNCDYTAETGIGDAGTAMRWDNPTEIRLAEYYRIHEVADLLCRMNDGQVVLQSELPKRKVREAMTWDIALDEATGKPLTRKTSRRQVQWFRLNGFEVVDQIDLPGRYIPVIRSLGNELDIDGQVKRKGMVQDLIDPARMYNYWRTAETERYGLAPKAPWVAAEGQIDGHPEWHDANRKSYSVLTYKPVVLETASGAVPIPPPQRQNPTAVEDGFAQAASGAEHDLMSVAGMPGDDPEVRRRVVSGDRHLQRRQGMQDLTHYQYYDNHTLALAWTGELLLELIPYYYDTQRVQRIIGEDGVPKLITLNEQKEEDGVTKVLNDMSVGKYSVVMDTGPGYATQREEASDDMMNLLATPLGEAIVQTGPDIVVRTMSFHGSDELADRLAVTTPGGMDKIMEGLPKQAQTVIQALQRQMAQKDEQIKSQGLEIAYAQGKERMRVQGVLEKTDRDNETKVQVQAMKGTDQRDVAEIHAATQLLNTKAEQEHEENMSDKLIKEGVENAQKD